MTPRYLKTKNNHRAISSNMKTIDFKVPSGWSELSDKQLRYVFCLIALNFTTDEVKLMCLLRWSGTKVIGRQGDGSYLLRKGKDLFELSSLQVAELLVSMKWLERYSHIPVRISKLRGHKALPADFEGVSFEKFIMVDNLYQGYMSTQNDELLDVMASVLYGHEMKLKPYQRVNVFYWFASVKDYLSRKYSDFFQPVSNDGNMLGSSLNVEDAMNAQIRALTKGDITKEKDILNMDTWRALTELNAQAREYKELNTKIKSK